MFEFLSSTPTPVWVVLVTSIVLGLVARAARKPPGHEAGWLVMRPGAAVYVVAVLAALMAALFGLMAFSGLASLLSGHLSMASWLSLVLALPLTVTMGLAAARLLFVQIRFNDQGVAWHRYGRTSFVAWQDIVRFKRHAFLGPQLHVRDGRRIGVYQYLRGFPDLVAALTARGIPVELTP